MKFVELVKCFKKNKTIPVFCEVKWVIFEQKKTGELLIVGSPYSDRNDALKAGLDLANSGKLSYLAMLSEISPSVN